jgi:hypothetical protein
MQRLLKVTWRKQRLLTTLPVPRKLPASTGNVTTTHFRCQADNICTGKRGCKRNDWRKKKNSQKLWRWWTKRFWLWSRLRHVFTLHTHASQRTGLLDPEDEDSKLLQKVRLTWPNIQNNFNFQISVKSECHSPFLVIKAHACHKFPDDWLSLLWNRIDAVICLNVKSMQITWHVLSLSDLGWYFVCSVFFYSSMSLIWEVKWSVSEVK